MTAPIPGRTAEQIGRTDAGPRPVPDLAAPPRRRPQTVRDEVLDNGLRLLVARKPGAPLVEARLRIPFAGRTPNHAARAELLASTLLLGTGRRSREQVDIDLADVGGHLDAGVDPQRLLLSGSVLSTGLRDLLDVLADSLLDPAFRRHDVLGERDRLVEHLTLSAAQPSVQARMQLQQRRFGTHPATWEMPDPARVDGVGPAALRSLHAAAVVPNGATLVLVGDLSPARAVDSVATALADWRSPRTAVRLGPPPPVPPGPILAQHRPDAVQSQIRLTTAAPERSDSDYPAAQLANLVFGGYFSSRLMENIREDKGYTYSAHSSFEFWPGRAALTISFDTTTVSTAAALWEAHYEWGRMVVQPPTPAEVQAARNYAIGSLATSLATQAGYASTLSSLVGLGLDVDWVREHPARLAAVTAEQVADVAARVFAPAAGNGVLLGNLDVIGDSLAALGGVVRS